MTDEQPLTFDQVMQGPDIYQRGMAQQSAPQLPAETVPNQPSILQDLAAPLKAGMQAMGAGAAAVHAGIPPVLKSLARGGRNIAALGERTIAQNALEGADVANPPEPIQQRTEQAAQELERPLLGAAEGPVGEAFQMAGNLPFMAMSPELVAAQQLLQGGQVNGQNVLNATLTELGGRALPAFLHGARANPLEAAGTNLAATGLSGKGAGGETPTGTAANILMSAAGTRGEGEAPRRLEPTQMKADIPASAFAEQGGGPFTEQPLTLQQVAGPEVVSKWQAQQREGSPMLQRAPEGPLSRFQVPAEMRRRAGMIQLPGGGEEAPKVPTPPPLAEQGVPEEMENAAAQQNPELVPKFAAAPETDLKAPELDLTPRPAANADTGQTPVAILESLKQPREATEIAEPTKPTLREKATAMVRSIFHPEGTQTLAENFGSAQNMKMQLANKAEDFVKDFGKLSPEEQERNHQALDQTGQFVSPAIQKHAQLVQDINTEFNKQFVKLGVDPENLRPNWFTMSMFDKPKGMSDFDYNRKIGDAENYFKERSNPTIADAKAAAGKLGLTMRPNLAEGQLRAWSNMADALANRNMLMGAVKRGSSTGPMAKLTGGRGASIIGANDPLPAGKTELPGWLASDQSFIQASGRDTNNGASRIVIDPGLRAAMEGWKQSQGSSPAGKALTNGSLKLRLMFDTVNGMRAVNGLAADALSGHAHGIGEGLVAARGDLNPEQNAVLKRAQEQGFTSSLLPQPKDITAEPPSFPVRAAKAVLKAPQHFAEAAKFSSVMEGTRHIMADTDLTPEQQNTKIQRLIKLADDQYGGKSKPNTLPAAVGAPLHALSPLLGYETAQARMIGRALTGDTTALRGLVSNAAIFLATNGLLTYALSGKSPTGEDFLHFNTGQKDKDGTEIRGHLPGIMSNFVDDTESISRGQWQDVVSRKINPLLTSIAQSATGRDYEGNALPSVGDKAKNILKNLVPIMPSGAKFWESPSEKNFESQGFPGWAQAFGVHGESRTLERSPFMRAAQQVESETRAPLTPDQQASQQQKFGWMDQVNTEEGLNKNLDAVVKDMTNAGYNADQITDLATSAQQPRDAGWYAQHLEPQQIAALWDKANKQEKLQIMQAISERVNNIKGDESPETVQGWIDLSQKIGQ